LSVDTERITISEIKKGPFQEFIPVNGVVMPLKFGDLVLLRPRLALVFLVDKLDRAFSDERLRGKTFAYKVKVNAIKQKSLPDLNDDFAKELGEFSTLDEVRQRIREGMEHERRHAAEREAKDKLLAQLIQRNEFEVPEALVERQIDVRLERGLRALAAQGLKSEDMKKMDLPRLRAGQRDQAVQEVKAALLLDKIADNEKIEVGDEEVDREIDALAKQTNQAPAAIRSRLTRDGALDRIRNRIRSEKALDFLYRQPA
jgi:trigger factor